MLVRIRAGALGLALTCCALGCAGGAPRHTPNAARPAVASREPFADLDRISAATLAAFDRARAMRVVTAADAGFRTRGNTAYRAALEAVRARLLEAGYVASQPGGGPGGVATVTYEPLNNDVEIWDAHAASIEVVVPARETVLSFDAQHDDARTMLVAFGPPGEVTGELAVLTTDTVGTTDSTSLADRVVLADTNAADFAQGPGRRAAAILSTTLERLNHADRHPDMVRYDTATNARHGGPLLLDVSPRAATRLRELASRGRVVVRVRADATIVRGRAETLVARLEGSDTNAAPIVVAAHADEPGANDNGSGLATLAEVAAQYLAMIRATSVPPPRRSVVFLFGTEIEAPERWMAFHPTPKPSFALALDMTGEAPATAPMLIERMPDPATRGTRPFDAHTEWFTPPAPHVRDRAHFLNAYAVSVMRRVERDWPVRDHPFEGGSDHEPFLQLGVPAVLFWHFPDEAYHTSVDRLPRVDAGEMARVAAGTLALVAHAAAAGTPQALDLVAIVERYANERLGLETREAAHGGDAASWVPWLQEALASCREFALAPSPEVEQSIADAQRRIRAR